MIAAGRGRPLQSAYEWPSVPEFHRIVASTEPLRSQGATHGALLTEPWAPQGPMQHWRRHAQGFRRNLHIHQMIPTALNRTDFVIPLQPVEAVQARTPMPVLTKSGRELGAAAAVEQHQGAPILFRVGGSGPRQETSRSLRAHAHAARTWLHRRHRADPRAALMSARQSMSQSMNRAQPSIAHQDGEPEIG